MDHAPSQQAVRDLDDLSRGDVEAAERLTPTIYAELRALAGSYFRQQPKDHTLEPTALVHEAFVRLGGRDDGSGTSRAHFIAIAARAMRQVLINHAEKRSALKRGGGRRRLQLHDGIPDAIRVDADLLALEEALAALETRGARKARVVEMRFFAGMTIEQIAHVLGVSTTTVDDDWRMARAWLADRMDDDDAARS